MIILAFIIGLTLGFILAPHSVAQERVKYIAHKLKPRAKPVVVKPDTTEDEDAKIAEMFGFEE